MKKILLAVTLLILTVITSRAQITPNPATPSQDTIKIKKSFGGGYHFYKGDQKLTAKQLQTVLKTNELAYEQFESAKASNTFATILSYAGGFLIGWPIGTAIGGGKPNWTLAGIGAGLTVVSIPFGQTAKKKAKIAVSTYNAGITSKTIANFNSLSLSITGREIGIQLKF